MLSEGHVLTQAMYPIQTITQFQAKPSKLWKVRVMPRSFMPLTLPKKDFFNHYDMQTIATKFMKMGICTKNSKIRPHRLKVRIMPRSFMSLTLLKKDFSTSKQPKTSWVMVYMQTTTTCRPLRHVDHYDNFFENWYLH